jgi:hypothetical protein
MGLDVWEVSAPEEACSAPYGRDLNGAKRKGNQGWGANDNTTPPAGLGRLPYSVKDRAPCEGR